MHSAVNKTPPGLQTDHINRNPLDNRKCNLRICTQKQNIQNTQKRRNTKSIYKGVTFQRYNRSECGFWRAYINKNSKRIHLGVFASEIKAGMAYNVAATMLFGTYACLNPTQPGLEK